ncbi:helix-turn-helix transcriptional regulator [Pseudoleptotrichia goodfellowii]|uniref:HTH domain protein n=1 Tax=Pseudoleptotrichia goodfellowii F0264 TaxID=596323 RepID=D0GMW5_9FUSO|nr:HTH domain-containing protein [Pseudoleptotrichia goodfellowii]EEY34567.1 HTH domain protein [Pseudoleptotrichia goodfellowii F0264]MBF4805641.1 HTH domain-containing protein [Pseudoleptotrichia goodfellowii]
MTKSERINDMIIFLSKKNYFNLKDITERYSISKRTALRDVQSLEKLGLAIYSEVGRYGKYKVLNNKLLSPVLFTADEISALYFGMLTLDAYEMCPLNLNKDKLKEKFEACLSKKQSEKIFMIEKIMKTEMKKSNENSRILKDIVEVITENKVCKISYKGNEKKEEVQFLGVFAEQGRWNAKVLSYKNGKNKVLKCNKIISVEKTDIKPFKTLEEIIVGL